MTTYLLIASIVIGLTIIVLLLIPSRKDKDIEALRTQLERMEQQQKDDSRRQEELSARQAKEQREELSQQARIQREETATQAKEQREETARQAKEQRSEIREQITEIRSALDQSLKGLTDVTEKKLEEMRATVDEKLQKTLNERIGQSFKLVSEQLENVQKGLGEMQHLASDVGGLKKVLSNVKNRGTFGEVQLQSLLEEMLAPDQYEANIRTAHTGTERVEFAVKLPGKDDDQGPVYLPIDSKFPMDVYEQYTAALEKGEQALAEERARQLEITLKKMARDIRDKYIDPPYTTDFAIMFVPFESIYAEILRRPGLNHELQDTYHVMVTGPTTLGALLNSLQMGFRTLAIQKRSSEVWQTLGAIKTEFAKFNDLLDKAQKGLQSADKAIEQMRGTRTRAIIRRLRNVEALPEAETRILLPDIGPDDVDEDDTE
ncbi:MAG: DNA recombination protein RmuC [Bacteroidales bacterium]|nr:DNA recombination protein RmuC [Bacteroidales bacterium]